MEDVRYIKDFPEYAVDMLGNVYSFKYGKTRVMKANPTLKGYLQVSLALNGKLYPRRVHRLVAEAFIPNPNNLPQVNHKDGNKLNNSVENLEWCTNSYNLHHSWEQGLREDVRNKARETINKVRVSKPVEMVDFESGNVLATFDSGKDASRKLFPLKDSSIVHAYMQSYEKNRRCVVFNGKNVYFRFRG